MTALTSSMRATSLVFNGGNKEPRSTQPKPVRVLYLDHTAKIGGGEVAIYNLVSSFDRARYTPVFVLATEGPLADRLRAAEIETHILPLDAEVNETRKDSLGVASLLNWKAMRICASYTCALVRLMRTLDIQIVHTNSLKSHLYGGIAGRIAGFPVIWHIRDNIDNSYLPDVVARGVRWLARHVPNYIIANSESTLQTLGLKSATRAAVVYSGIRDTGQHLHGVIHDGLKLADFTYAYSDKQMGIEAASQVVIMVGRIAEWKGQHVFIEAASQVLKVLPETRFQIVGAPLFGEYEYEKSLHEQVKRLGLESNIEFLGFREDVADLVGQCDLLVHASIIGEPFGQVVVEGMICGKPVIATNGGGLREIVVPGETGLLVTMGDVTEMAEAMETLLRDPIQAHGLGMAGRKRAVERFSIQSSVSKLYEVYEQVVCFKRSDRC